MYIFCDSSVNNKSNVGIGAYLVLSDISDVKENYDIQTIKLDGVTSTIAEFLTIRHVLLNIKECTGEIYLYTDCQNFVNLINERQYKPNLVKHRNYELYKELIDLVEKFNVKIIWTKGHSSQDNKKENYQKIFSRVDHHAREILRYFFL